MKTFRTELRSKINEFLFDRLAKMDTQSEEFWVEADLSNHIYKDEEQNAEQTIMHRS